MIHKVKDMSEHSGPSKTVKVASILLLLANYALTASAAPLGAAEMTVSRFYWLFLIVVLAVLSLIYMFSKQESPIEVMGLTYDKTTHQMELTVRNTGSERYCIRSALRLMAPAQEVIDQVADDGNIPMAAARASVGDRSLFQLLCEDDSPVVLEPNETRTLAYDVLMPAEMINLDSSKDVEVHINFGEHRTPSMQPQPDGLCIHMGSGDVIAEAYLLEDLLGAVRNSSDDVIAHHMADGNDFADWVRNVLGDGGLADQLDTVEPGPEAGERLASILDSKVESLKHPYLRRVHPEKKFLLKAGHDDVVSEITVLDDLAEKLAKASAESVAFHLRDGNDFAAWTHSVVGDEELAEQLNGIEYGSPEDARDRMVSAIRARVDSLKT